MVVSGGERNAFGESDLGRTLFEETTGRILEELDLSPAKQRMDSTHITSHIAQLTRLGTCCETIRLFLQDLKAQHPEAFAQVPESLRARYFRPDGNYSGSDVALEAASRGTEVNGSVKGGDKSLPQEDEIKWAEFTIVTDDARQTRCPPGHAPREQTFDAETGQRKLIFDVADCQACPLRERCPTTVMKKATKSAAAGGRQLQTTREKLCTAQRQRDQTTDEFRKRHANRAGIEATNSEWKRRHELGRLRVRGLPRVNLAVLLKVVACNLKRYLHYQQALVLR